MVRLNLALFMSLWICLPITFRIKSEFLTLPYNALHNLTPVSLLDLIPSLFPPSSMQYSQDTGFTSDF